MTAAPVVVDASPLISLSRIGRLQLLGQLYHTILLPPAVAQEVGSSLASQPWLVPARPRSVAASILAARLGAGETEALALALERGARVVILDDAHARRLAGRLGLSTIGTVGLLVEAKTQGLLARVRPELDALVGSGSFVSLSLYLRALASAGEAP